MFRNSLIEVFAVMALLCGVTCAQERLNCSSAVGLDFNQTELFGTWYEVSRHPAQLPNGNHACVRVSSELDSNKESLLINLSYTLLPADNNNNATIYSKVKLVENHTAGYNITLKTSDPPIFTKLLEKYESADGVKWLAACGYKDAANASTVYSYLLARNNTVNATSIAEINNKANQTYSDFGNDFVVIQQQGCYKDSASLALPALSVIMAAVWVLIKVF